MSRKNFGNGPYRAIYVKIWSDPDFQRLDLMEQLCVFYLLCGPQSNRIGLYHFSFGMMAETLNIGHEHLQQSLDSIFKNLRWKYDPVNRVVWIPSWWRYNPPFNVNVLKGALDDLATLPASRLVSTFLSHTSTLPEALGGKFLEIIETKYPHLLGWDTIPDRQGYQAIDN